MHNSINKSPRCYLQPPGIDRMRQDGAGPRLFLLSSFIEKWPANAVSSWMRPPDTVETVQCPFSLLPSLLFSHTSIGPIGPINQQAWRSIWAHSRLHPASPGSLPVQHRTSFGLTGTGTLGGTASQQPVALSGRQQWPVRELKLK